jgi:hypothetical protein
MNPGTLYRLLKHEMETTFKTEREVELFYKGSIMQLERWAVWRDGTQYVGCGINTLAEAKSELEADKELAMKIVKEKSK